ncbi:MAG: hypothetical protein LBD72_02890 [Puniceicoccales bacterium]|nr:hypothetical protein [Puniceicoccales bacterium]
MLAGFFVAVDFIPKTLLGASLEITGKVFIGKSCAVVNNGEIYLNTSQAPGAAILIGPEASRVSFEGPGEITIYGNPGIEITDERETSLIFRMLPNFSAPSGQSIRTAISGNQLTTVRFENVQGFIRGSAAAGLFWEDNANISFYGQNLLQAPIIGSVQFDEGSSDAVEKNPITEDDGKSALGFSETLLSPSIYLRVTQNILLQAAPINKDAILIGRIKTSRSDYGGIFLAYCCGLKNTPMAIAAITGQIKSNWRIEQKYCGVCWTNALENFTWSMYGFSGKNHQCAPAQNCQCIGCFHGYSPGHISLGNYAIKPIFNLGVEHKIMRHATWNGRTGNFSETLANFSLELKLSANANKTNLAAKIESWRSITSAFEAQASEKLRAHNICYTKHISRNLKGMLALTRLSFCGNDKPLYWSFSVIYTRTGFL